MSVVSPVILLVDSYNPHRVLEEGILFRAGFHYFSATDATSAETVFAREEIDLVVVSARLAAGGPGYVLDYKADLEPTNSVRLVTRLRDKQLNLPVLFLLSRIPSANVFDALRLENPDFDCEAIGFLTRGQFDGEDMVRVIRELLGQ